VRLGPSALALIGPLAALSCGSEEIPNKPDAPPPLTTDHGVPDGHVFESFEGEITWKWDYDDDPARLTCDMLWEATGTASSGCPDCLWGFTLTLTLDEGRSQYDEGCLGTLEDADLEWRVGLDENYYGYNVATLSMMTGGYWMPGFVAQWDYPDLTWGGGWLYMPVTPGDPADPSAVMYTNYWYGTATVQ
jgi:hypothetical protein